MDVGLLGPALPDVAAHLWHLFLDLHKWREYGESGPKRLSYSLMLAAPDIIGVRLSCWEISVINRLDSLWLKTVNED